jgi:hypothetical protein
MKNSCSVTRRKFLCASALASVTATRCFEIGSIAAENSRLIPLDPPDHLILKGCSAAMVEHRGHRALQLSGLSENADIGGELAIIPELVFKNGTIEVELAGAPVAGPTPGFLGLAFHIDDEKKRFEHVYLRPKNGRHENQLQRNHSCQYASQPNFGWKKLREEFPGVYESYVDLEVDAWTKMRLEIRALKLRLFVNDAAQPCLVVNDLKLGEVAGGIALWIDTQTRAFFRNLRVTHR